MADHVAEMALIDSLYSGGCDPGDAAQIYAALVPESFADTRLARIFDAARQLFIENPEAVDSELAIDLLTRTGELKAAGGATFVAEATSAGCTGVNALLWSKRVAEDSRRRKLASAAKSAAEAAADPGAALEAAASAFSDLAKEIAADSAGVPEVSVTDLLRREFKAIEDRHRNPDHYRTTPSGFYKLDDLTGGFAPGDLVIVAGRPAMGKTALALCCAMNAARAGHNTLLVSLEMTSEQLAQRLLTMQSGVPIHKMATPKNMSNDQWTKLGRANESVSADAKGLTIIDSSRLTVNDIRAAARSSMAKRGLSLIIVDYLQMIRPVAKGHNREREVADISCELKSIAKDFRVPVMCLAQLNRQTEQNGEKRPTLSNLRESGSIEQDADQVIFVHRDSYYKPNPTDDEKKQAQIIVAKNRNGDTGPAEVGWNGERMLFFNREVYRAG